MPQDVAFLAKVSLYRVRLSGWALKLDIINAKMYTFLPNKKEAGVTAFMFSLFVIISRIYVGHYYPTDVMAGFLFGAGTSVIAVKRWKQYARGSRKSDAHHFS